MSEFAYGREFTQEARHQIGNVIVGRDEAVIAGLTGLVGNMNVGFAGGTGKAKTEMMEAFPYLVHDIYPENVAVVPIDNALSGIQIIGGESAITRETTSNNVSDIERVVTFLKGVVGEDTQIVQIDEINRIPVKALNIFLTALEKRRVSTVAGIRNLPRLEAVYSTMNPKESPEATSPVAHATISRIALGAIFDRGGTRDERIAQVLAIGNLPKGGKIEPITDLATIHLMRENAKSLQISESLDRKIAEMSVDASDALWQQVNLDDGEERLSVQVRKSARVLSVLAGEQAVSGNAVNAAMTMAINARVGMAHPNAVEVGPQIVKSIVYANAA